MDKYLALARSLPNQDLSALKNDTLETVANLYLPDLCKAWNLIEQVTGYRWKPTSYIRQSPNHQYGIALDVAPDIQLSSEPLYAVHSRLNPFLYKRGVLVRKLQQVIPLLFSQGKKHNVIVVIECDHLHLQIMSGPPTLVKWKAIKPVYSNSEAQHDLPMIN